jgi:hypothetical protein
MRARGLLALLTATVLLASCSINIQIPSLNQSNSAQPAVATVVAETMQAIQAQGAATPAALASPGLTPTPGKATLTINGNSNCRESPSGSAKNVTAFTPGTTLELVAKDTADDYWQVKIPNSTDTCWVWGKYATASGSLDSLPDSASGSSTSGPDAPLFLPSPSGWTYFCRGSGQADITLRWRDVATNETGYRIYRNGGLVAELPADSTSYSETITLLSGQSVGYQVAAFNANGEGRSGVATMKCP